VSADTATMYVDRHPCGASGDNCGIRSLMRGTGIKILILVTPRGAFEVTADRPSRLIPIDWPLR
jgi:hypothetical protein